MKEREEYQENEMRIKVESAYLEMEMEEETEETRPDTRPPVADGWAGADMRIFPLFDLC